MTLTFFRRSNRMDSIISYVYDCIFWFRWLKEESKSVTRLAVPILCDLSGACISVPYNWLYVSSDSATEIKCLYMMANAYDAY